MVLPLLVCCAKIQAQGAVPGKVPQWGTPFRVQTERQSALYQVSETAIDEGHPYSLAELVDLAETHNPRTRAAWQIAKERGADLRIAKSDLLPALTALALANTQRQGVLMNGHFVRETLGVFEPLLQLDYLIVDGGARWGKIKEARAALLKSEFSFNRVHLDVLFQTAQAYYHLLDTLGQRDAAQISLKNAATVRDAVRAQLAVGLATKPDALEAVAEADRADFQLETAKGNVDVAHAGLLTILGASPLAKLAVEPLVSLPEPQDDQGMPDVSAAISRALTQRPEIGEPLEDEKSALAQVTQARSAYFPQLSFSGNAGEARVYGQQNQLPAMYVGPVEVWKVSLQLKWDLFDGGRREAEIAKAHAAIRQAEAETQKVRDEVEEQVVTASVSVRTAFVQRKAAMKSLESAQLSYDASLKSYELGLRSTVDLVAAQKALAEARSTEITARTNLLQQLAAFAYRTGDLQKTKVPQLPKGQP